ncbi:MAG: cupin domain-containing protein [Flavisolibacter sp.]
MESPKSFFQMAGKVSWDVASPGIQRQVYGFDENIMMVRVKFEKGAIGDEHRHVHTQVSYVESGVFEVMIGGERKTVKRGDGFFVPSNVLHGTLCLEPGVLIDVFAPQRTDFLKVHEG